MDGKYREINVRSSGSFHHKYPNPEIIPYKMKDLVENLKADLFGIATFFHDFLHIHPFSDGNGRTAHIICAVLLGSFVPLCFSSRLYLVRNMEKGLDYVFGYVLLCVSRFKPVHFT
jgi:Fic family protein